MWRNLYYNTFCFCRTSDDKIQELRLTLKIKVMKKSPSLMRLLLFLFGIENPEAMVENARKEQKKPKKKRKFGYWKPSPQSEYFGKRSKIVTAETPKGPKQMKLKNALKKGLEFNF